MMLTSIVLYTTLGYLLSVLGIEAWSAEWLCFVGLFMAHGWYQHSEGYDLGLDNALVVINRLENKIKELTK